MRKFIFALTGIFLYATSFTQQHEIDSFQRLIRSETNDSIRVELINALARVYVTNRPDTALKLSQEGLVLAKKMNVPLLHAKSLNSMGGVMWAIGDFPKALEYYLESLKVAEDIRDNELIAKVTSNIGNVYAALGDEETAVRYTKNSINIWDMASNPKGRCVAVLNLGDSYENLNMLDSARLYTTQANDLANKLKDTDLIAISLCNLGNIYQKMAQPAIAMSYYRASMPLCEEAGNMGGVSEVSIGMAELFKLNNQHDSAEAYAKHSFAVSKKAGFMPDLLRASEFLANHYKSNRNIDSAFAYMQQMVAFKDTMFNNEKARQVQVLSFQESIRQQQLEAQRIEAAQERKDNIQYAIIGVGVVTFLLIFLLLSRTVIVNEKWIRFLGILGLLLFFEFINLYLHPFLGDLTHHSPVLMLLIMVAIASLLIPLHHKVEHYITHKMTAKNRLIRLAAAQKTIAKLQETELSEQQP
ncbi:MAG: tetratricopeptide repeat protein [Chitinophagaceae bacterium]